MKFARAVAGVALLFASAAASAQSPNPEQFDMSGMQGNGLRQWAIKLSVIAHKSGDMKDAAKIQEQLADYYAEKGDSARSRAATAAQALALQMLSSGGNPTTSYPQTTPSMNPSANPGGGGTTPPSSNYVPPSNPSTYGPGGPTGPPSTSSSSDVGSMLQGSYTFTNPGNGVQSTWDFSPDGSYRYSKVGADSFSAPSTESGTYSISGGTLEMRPNSASGSPGGTVSNGTVHRYKVTVQGPGGRDGLILNGHQLQRKN